jgi:hypothetical protein
MSSDNIEDQQERKYLEVKCVSLPKSLVDNVEEIKEFLVKDNINGEFSLSFSKITRLALVEWVQRQKQIIEYVKKQKQLDQSPEEILRAYGKI